MSLVESRAAASETALAASERDRRGCLALDQWRGLALVLVLLSHGFFFTGRVYGIGRVGVNLFFFVSGILVFRSLARSKASSAAGRTRSFWWRRFRRLYPALLSYVVAMLVATWWLQRLRGLPPGSDFATYLRHLPGAIAYAINYLPTTPMSLGHLWSLACEMQFYLLAPLIYLAGGASEARRDWVFGAVLVVLVGLGLTQPFLGEGKYQFQFAVWPMMFGFCCEYKRDWFLRLPEWLVTVILWSSIAVCAASAGLMLFGLEMKLVVIAAGALLLAPCWLAYLFGRPVPGLAGRFLRWSGERTYSVYLWQQPLTICDFLPMHWHPLGALASLGVGAGWFRVFEYPFLSANRQRQEQAR